MSDQSETSEYGGRRDTESRDLGKTLSQISNEMVGLHKRYYGKGPTKAKTYMVDDVVICLLGGGLTTVERTLLGDGRVETVHAMRRTFQEAMEQEFTDIIERAIGRKVIAYMSQIHADPDIAIEIFVLEPIEGTGWAITSERLMH